MKIKLLYPPAITNHYESRIIDLPYGLSVLAAFLRSNHFSVDIDDLHAHINTYCANFGSRKILREILKFYQYQEHAGKYTGISDRRNVSLTNRLLDLVDVAGYDLVGIGINSGWQSLTAFLLAEKIKKEYKIPVVIGGPYVTLFADLFFRKYDFIDYAIAGEGEIPLLKFLHFIEGKEEIQNVPSLWHRNNSQVIFNGRTFYNIENQSCPDFESLPLKLYEKNWSRKKVLIIPYSTSKGCIYRCSFCLYPHIDGPWQCKSAEKVVKDIILLKQKYRSRFFKFEDTNLNISYEHVDKLCDGFIKKNVNINWIARVKGNNLDKKLIVKMKKAGCLALMWGIESGSDRILKLMKKDGDIEKQMRMLKMAKMEGLKSQIYLIIKYPYETTQDLKKTALLLKNNAEVMDWVTVYKLAIFHGSFLFNNADEIKIKLRTTKDSFYSYCYGYMEVAADTSKRQKKALERLRQKIASYDSYDNGYKIPKFFGLLKI